MTLCMPRALFIVFHVYSSSSRWAEECAWSHAVFIPMFVFSTAYLHWILTTSWMRNRELNCCGLSGSNFRQCFVSACLDEPDCGCCLLFSFSVSYNAELPLCFFPYNLPSSTENTLMHFLSLCLCLWSVTIYSSWRQWRGYWIYVLSLHLPLLAFTCFPWSFRWLGIFYTVLLPL